MVIIKITLRKKNSVTSIVLFIYNIYNQTMNEYEIELSELLDYIKKFGKSDSAARVSLSRLVKSNILINKNKDNDVYYQLTEEGLTNIKTWNRTVERFFKRYRLRQEQWDYIWTTITLLDFKKSNGENQFILENLNELGCREIDNNVWLSPYYFEKEIKSIFADEVDFLISRGVIETNINLDSFLQSIYQIDDLQERYKQLIDNIEKMKQEIEDKGLKGGDLLPLLFKLGWSLYDTVKDDPALPVCILDNWIGDRAVEETGEFREYLVEKISQYFKTGGTSDEI